MRLFNGFGCFLCGSLALLWVAPANPARPVKAALAPLDARATLANSNAAVAGPELKTALAEPDARAVLADPVIKVPLAAPEVNVSPLEASDECVLTEECIDQYLWSVYERARKVDTIKVEERIKVKVEKNGKSRWHVRGAIRDRRDGPSLQTEAVSSLSRAGRRRACSWYD